MLFWKVKNLNPAKGFEHLNVLHPVGDPCPTTFIYRGFDIDKIVEDPCGNLWKMNPYTSIHTSGGLPHQLPCRVMFAKRGISQSFATVQASTRNWNGLLFGLLIPFTSVHPMSSTGQVQPGIHGARSKRRNSERNSGFFSWPEHQQFYCSSS